MLRMFGCYVWLLDVYCWVLSYLSSCCVRVWKMYCLLIFARYIVTTKSSLFQFIHSECLIILASLLTGNIFYLMEFREIFLTLLRKFDERMQPRSFLRDLVESTHLFLRMLERFCKGRNNLLVQVSTTRVENSGENSLSNWAIERKCIVGILTCLLWGGFPEELGCHTDTEIVPLIFFKLG